MTKINSKLMIDYDDNNSYLDFISEKEVKYYYKSTVKYKDHIITFITKDKVKPVSIQQELDDNVIKCWEYSEELAESLRMDINIINIYMANIACITEYWIAIDTIEKEIQKHITNSYENEWITNKEYERKLNHYEDYEDDDISHTIENIQDMIEKEYGENATLAEIRQDSEYHYNLVIASTYLRTKHNL